MPGKKRELNKYFQTMLEAKEAGMPQFTYNNTTYVKTVLHNGLVTYKKESM